MASRRLDRLDPVSLRLFEAIVRLGSITAAGREHAIAASAVSRRLSDMEALVGEALVVRGARGVTTTAAGQALLRHSQGILGLLGRLDGELDLIATGRTGEISIAAVTSAIIGRLAGDIARLQREAPGLRITLTEVNSGDGLRLLVNGEVDVAIVASPRLQDGMRAIRYAADPICVIVPAGHPLLQAAGRDGAIDFADTLPHAVIRLGGGATIDHLVEVAAQFSDSSLRDVFEVRSFTALVGLVEAGLGIGFLRESGAGFHTRGRAIERLSLRDPWARQEIMLVNRMTEPTRAIRTFLKLVDDLDQKME
jgi:molybdate transport repressor ModE-like protein